MSDSCSRTSSNCGLQLNNLLQQLKRHDRKEIVSDIVYDLESKKYYDPIMSSKHHFAMSRFYHSTPTPVHPSVEKWFRAMETKNDGRLSAKELQQAYAIFQGKHYSDAVCKFVVRLFDLDQSGTLDLKEFESLYACIKQWVGAFKSYDRDKSGYLDETELDYALKTMDIKFNPDFIRYLIRRNNPKARKMAMDQYILTCIQIQRFTEEFKSRDTDYTGKINIKYEDFLEMIMRCL